MTKADTHCVGCGCVITDEVHNGDPAGRNPCPKCGSLARAFSLELFETLQLSDSAEIAVVSYPKALLLACRSLIDDGQYGISVVVAHMACEVSVERALSAAFVSKSLQYLKDSVIDFLNGYNLSNDKNRKLYTALTGDYIEQQIFWPEFKESASRRNKIVHGCSIISKVEAEKSLCAASAFIFHIEPINVACAARTT